MFVTFPDPTCIPLIVIHVCMNTCMYMIFSRSMTRAEGTKESRTRVSERGFFLNIVACDRRVCVRVSPRADMSPTFLTYLRKVILRDILN